MTRGFTNEWQPGDPTDIDGPELEKPDAIAPRCKNCGHKKENHLSEDEFNSAYFNRAGKKWAVPPLCKGYEPREEVLTLE